MSRYPQVLEAIKKVRARVRWKPNSQARHLQKRKQRRHLPQSATKKDYDSIIQTVLHDKSAQVYQYWYNQIPYVTIVAKVQMQLWLVMFAYDGVLESAFVVERAERYLSKPGFEWIGLLGDLEDEL